MGKESNLIVSGALALNLKRLTTSLDVSNSSQYTLYSFLSVSHCVAETAESSGFKDDIRDLKVLQQKQGPPPAKTPGKHARQTDRQAQ